MTQNNIFSNEEDVIAKAINDRGILRYISSAVNITQKDLVGVLNVRRTETKMVGVEYKNSSKPMDVTFQNGYHAFQTAKSSGGFRVINEPHPNLKNVQTQIKDKILNNVTIYNKAIAGEKGKSFIDNAKLHAGNNASYMINLDVQNAYPSVTSQRVKANLRGGLGTYFEFSNAPEALIDDILNTLVIFTTFQNQLPQGSPASMKLFNIVMAQTDLDIQKYLSKASNLESPLYSRYADDMTISFRGFSNVSTLKKIVSDALKVKKCLESKIENFEEISDEEIASMLTGLSRIMVEVRNMSFIFPHLEAKKYFITFINSCKGILSVLKEEPYVQDSLDLDMEVFMLNKFRSDLNREATVYDGAGNISKDIQKIVYDQGWVIKEEKTSIFTPSSSKQPVVTGISIDRKGRLGIEAKKMKKYYDFANNLYYNPEKLGLPYVKNGALNIEKIQYTLGGMIAFITSVKGKIPADFARIVELCEGAYKLKITNRHYNVGSGDTI